MVTKIFISLINTLNLGILSEVLLPPRGVNTRFNIWRMTCNICESKVMRLMIEFEYMTK